MALHPSGFPESSLSQLRAACRELAQVLTANGLDAAAPAGRMAPSSPEDWEPETDAAPKLAGEGGD